MSDTSPSEIAALITDEPRYRTFVVLKLQEHGNRLTNIEARVQGVSSAVQDEQKSNRYSLKEMVVGFLILCGALGSLIGFIFWVIGNAGKGAP